MGELEKSRPSASEKEQRVPVNPPDHGAGAEDPFAWIGSPFFKFAQTRIEIGLEARHGLR
jgi:hypothetical protein